jgi:ABC-type hemin transport system ATPase subunit
MASIRTAGLTKDFGDLRAVNEIDLDLPEGGVAGFVGPNGAVQQRHHPEEGVCFAEACGSARRARCASRSVSDRGSSADVMARIRRIAFPDFARSVRIVRRM